MEVVATKEADDILPGIQNVCHGMLHAILQQPVNFTGMNQLQRLMSVMPLAGPSLLRIQSIKTNHALPFEIWKNVFRDMLRALQFLHEDCGIVHGGPSWLLFLLAMTLRQSRRQDN